MGYPPQILQKSLAPRPDSLEGKPVYLVDCRFDDGDILIAQMADWFAEHRPDDPYRGAPQIRCLYGTGRGALHRNSGERGCGHRRRGALKHLCAGGRRPMHHFGNRIRSAHGFCTDQRLRGVGKSLDSATGHSLSAPRLCTPTRHGQVTCCTSSLYRWPGCCDRPPLYAGGI